MGESQTPSMPISLRYSSFDVIPLRSPIPSLLLSLNDLNYKTIPISFNQRLVHSVESNRKRNVGFPLPWINLIEISTFVPIVGIGFTQNRCGQNCCQNKEYCVYVHVDRSAPFNGIDRVACIARQFIGKFKCRKK